MGNTSRGAARWVQTTRWRFSKNYAGGGITPKVRPAYALPVRTFRNNCESLSFFLFVIRLSCSWKAPVKASFQVGIDCLHRKCRKQVDGTRCHGWYDKIQMDDIHFIRHAELLSNERGESRGDREALTLTRQPVCQPQPVCNVRTSTIVLLRQIQKSLTMASHLKSSNRTYAQLYVCQRHR